MRPHIILILTAELAPSPAMTEHELGKGKAVYYGSLLNLESARSLLRRYAREAGLHPILANAPEQIEVTRRTKGATEFCFLLNHGDTPAEVAVEDGYVDALTGEVAPTKLTFAPFDYHVLRREVVQTGSSP